MANHQHYETDILHRSTFLETGHLRFLSLATVRLARATYLEQPVIAAAQRFAAELEVVVAEGELDWIINLMSPTSIPATLDRIALAAGRGRDVAGIPTSVFACTG